MQQFPNYYQMPNYQNSYQQQMINMSNPYLDRMNQLQQFQQNLQGTQMSLPNNQFVPLGKMVESEDIVRATDIPMDGNMYYFPKADGSMIFGKQWLANGTTRLIAFKPILDDEASNYQQGEIKSDFGAFGEVLDGIQADIKTLSDKIDKLSKSSTSYKGKKEVADE